MRQQLDQVLLVRLSQNKAIEKPLRPQLREPLTKTKLLWDSKKLAFSNLDQANQYIRRDYRKGWEVKGLG